MHQLWDWVTFFKPYTDRMQGFCTSQFGAGMHECRTCVETVKVALSPCSTILPHHTKSSIRYACVCYLSGHARVWFRKSSRASTWLPEGQDYRIFDKGLPQMPPPIYKVKSDASWGRRAQSKQLSGHGLGSWQWTTQLLVVSRRSGRPASPSFHLTNLTQKFHSRCK